MSDFINQLLHRHTQTEQNVQPRNRSRFEPVDGFTENWGHHTTIESSAFNLPTINKEEETAQPLQKAKTGQEDLVQPASTRLNPDDTHFTTNIQSSSLAFSKFPKTKVSEIAIEKSSDVIDSIKPKLAAVKSNLESKQTNILNNRQKEEKSKKSEPSTVSFKETLSDQSQVVKPILRSITPSTEDFSNLINTLQNSSVAFSKQENNYASFSKQEQTPTIKVNIGRIEVRAIMPKKSSPPIRKKSTPKPQMSLEDYLKKQNNKR